MSDVIVQRFEADSADFVREVNKARESVRKMTATDLPILGQEMDRGFGRATKLARGMNQVNTETRRSGQNMLVFAQVADDAQYGMRGLNNQIPQLVQALGAGAGLAGTISLATMAAYYMGPQLMTATGLIDGTGRAVNGMNAQMGTLLNTYHMETEALKAQALERRKEIENVREHADALKQLGMGPDTAAGDKRIKDMKTEAEFSRQLLDQELKLARMKASNPADAAKAESAVAQKQAERDISLMKSEIAERKRLQDEVNAAYQKNFALASQEESAVIKEKNANEALIEQLEKKIRMKKLTAAGSDAILQASAAAGFDNKKVDYEQTLSDKLFLPKQGAKNLMYTIMGQGNDVDLAGVARAGKDAADAAAEMEKELAKAKAASDVLLANHGKLKQTVEQTQAAFDAKNKAQSEEIAMLERKIAQQKQIKNVSDEILKSEIAAAEQAKAKAEAEKRATEAKQAAVEAQRAAEGRKREGMAREDVMVEVRALELQARGREKEANALRDALRMKREVAELVERAAISEAQATQIVERKFALERALTGEKEKAERGDRRRDGRIRLFDRGESAGGAFAARDLGKSVIERNVLIAQQRGAALRGESPALTQMGGKVDDLHATMKKMLGIWEGVSAK